MALKKGFQISSFQKCSWKSCISGRKSARTYVLAVAQGQSSRLLFRRSRDRNLVAVSYPIAVTALVGHS